MEFSDNDIRRFWSRVDKSGECWLWQGSKTRGYGHFFVGKKSYIAHRFAYAITHNHLPPELDVLHSCDNPACVRPDHLHLGTHMDNMRERTARGRTSHGDKHWMRRSASPFRGERHPRARLTTEQVEQIRQTYRAGGITHQKLADQYGVCVAAIGHITRGDRWK